MIPDATVRGICCRHRFNPATAGVRLTEFNSRGYVPSHLESEGAVKIEFGKRDPFT